MWCNCERAPVEGVRFVHLNVGGFIKNTVFLAAVAQSFEYDVIIFTETGDNRVLAKGTQAALEVALRIFEECYDIHRYGVHRGRGGVIVLIQKGFCQKKPLRFTECDLTKVLGEWNQNYYQHDLLDSIIIYFPDHDLVLGAGYANISGNRDQYKFVYEVFCNQLIFAREYYGTMGSIVLVIGDLNDITRYEASNITGQIYSQAIGKEYLASFRKRLNMVPISKRPNAFGNFIDQCLTNYPALFYFFTPTEPLLPDSACGHNNLVHLTQGLLMYVDVPKDYHKKEHMVWRCGCGLIVPKKSPEVIRLHEKNCTPQYCTECGPHSKKFFNKFFLSEHMGELHKMCCFCDNFLNGQWAQHRCAARDIALQQVYDTKTHSCFKVAISKMSFGLLTTVLSYPPTNFDLKHMLKQVAAQLDAKKAEMSDEDYYPTPSRKQTAVRGRRSYKTEVTRMNQTASEKLREKEDEVLQLTIKLNKQEMQQINNTNMAEATIRLIEQTAAMKLKDRNYCSWEELGVMTDKHVQLSMKKANLFQDIGNQTVEMKELSAQVSSSENDSESDSSSSDAEEDPVPIPKPKKPVNVPAETVTSSLHQQQPKEIPNEQVANNPYTGFIKYLMDFSVHNQQPPLGHGGQSHTMGRGQRVLQYLNETGSLEPAAAQGPLDRYTESGATLKDKAEEKGKKKDKKKEKKKDKANKRASS